MESPRPHPYAGRTPARSLLQSAVDFASVWYESAMRIVLQRVLEASVSVDGEVVGEVGEGLVALVGIAAGDDAALIDRAVAKTATMRIFRDDAGRFDRSVTDTAGAVLVVSQFTLLADTRKGNRPSFTGAADPDVAAPLVERYAEGLRALGLEVATGRFAADMRVALVNDGPVTIVLDL
jgi:D-tyrosyl-tRNA(Tyr) deacylase